MSGQVQEPTQSGVGATHVNKNGISSMFLALHQIETSMDGISRWQLEFVPFPKAAKKCEAWRYKCEEKGWRKKKMASMRAVAPLAALNNIHLSQNNPLKNEMRSDIRLPMRTSLLSSADLQSTVP